MLNYVLITVMIYILYSQFWNLFIEMSRNQAKLSSYNLLSIKIFTQKRILLIVKRVVVSC